MLLFSSDQFSSPQNEWCIAGKDVRRQGPLCNSSEDVNEHNHYGISMEHFQKFKIKARWGTAEMAGWVKCLPAIRMTWVSMPRPHVNLGCVTQSGIPVHLWRDGVWKKEIPESSWVSKPCIHSGEQHRNLASNNVKGEDWWTLPSKFYMCAMTCPHLHSKTCTPMHTDRTCIHICIYTHICTYMWKLHVVFHWSFSNDIFAVWVCV